MKFAVLILSDGDTDDSPRNEYVVEAEDRSGATEEARKMERFFHGSNASSRVARVRQLPFEEYFARCENYEGYMNGGYLDYFNPFTMEGYLD